MDLGLNDATVVVSGGTKGMGRAAAECFAAEGARVAVLGRTARRHGGHRQRDVGAPGAPTPSASRRT